MVEKTVKFKRVDTGKMWICGNLKDGKYGPQIGMKKTPELEAYLNSVASGGWINFNIYEAYDVNAPKAAPRTKADDELDSGIIF